MKYDLFFQLAKEAGIEEAELFIENTKAISFSLFHSKIDNYKISDATSIIARGLVNGKFGAVTCDSWSKNKVKYIVDEIVKNAKAIENDDPQFIFEGSEKYHKFNRFNKELAKVSVDEKINKAKELEAAIKNFSPMIVEVPEVEYEEQEETITLINSKGLKLTQKTNYFVFVGVALASDGKQSKSGYDLFVDNDFTKFSPKELADKIGKETTEQLGGEPCETKNYKAVLAPDVVASLMQAYLSSISAEEVQKQSSLFIGKLGKPVASKLVTIEDKPISKNIFSRWFDDEGVATSNKPLIKNGILQTYLYNLTTAAKDGVTSTGNGYRSGGSMSIAPSFLTFKHGKKSLDELFEKVQNGVYITDISGLHAGLNPQSGNFSLQSTGFLIENGKKTKGLDVITVSGNLVDLFNDIIAVGNNVKISPSGTSTPSVVVKKLNVTGK